MRRIELDDGPTDDPSAVEACANCVFYRPHPGGEGQCRRNAPPESRRWPWVEKHHWCGEWELRTCVACKLPVRDTHSLGEANDQQLWPVHAGDCEKKLIQVEAEVRRELEPGGPRAVNATGKALQDHVYSVAIGRLDYLRAKESR